MLTLRNYDIKYIKGIGPGRAELLSNELGLKTAYDLLHYFPSHYIDRSRTYSIHSLKLAEGELPSVQIKGRFVTFNTIGEGSRLRLIGLFSDGTATLECVWFKSAVRMAKQKFKTGLEYVLFGKPTRFNGTLQLTHPEVDLPDSVNANEGLHGIYPLTEKLRQKSFDSRAFYTAISSFLLSRKSPLKDTLPPSIISELGLMSLDDAIRQIHTPASHMLLEKARFRLKFEELFLIQVDMLKRSRKRKDSTDGYLMPRVGRWFNDFYNICLPFPLTEAQKRVIKEIRADMLGGRQMNRLVQGDVGSGKTLVALMCMLLAIDNGFQACIMAPTEILASQHYETITSLTAKIGLNVRLLTGSTRKAERRIIDEQLRDGSLHILVGTHAVIEDNVVFRNLGFVVIDEQHRFGVAQRAKLWAKSDIPPHVLVMTATPIPRTLAMTVYGDLDVSVIDELPPGRKPVTTVLRYEEQTERVIKAAMAQIKAGHQIYIVYPLVEESEKLDLKSATEGYEMACRIFSGSQVAFVHGRMKPAEKEAQMQLFVSGKADILVSTTVIEVGVNVPNATTMIIQNAERFGLSQLHQLRGRVGRGADKSYCVLMSKYKISSESKKRLELMTQTNDGFVIAEADMKMRGPGDIEGTMQSGLPFALHIANLSTDGRIIQLARTMAEKLLEYDPVLEKTDNACFRRSLELATMRTTDWSRIS